ncbi:MAG TPA: amidohydrolase family protein [Steroidobacteraceae bacterium]|nr:amidohydrolase family protein [Steroidobacteraceae bacterium]
MSAPNRIDAHQHFWRRERGDYTWLTPALGPIYRDYLPADLAPQLALTGIGHTILVQAAATVEETRFMLGLARENPFIAGVVGWVDFESDDAPRAIDDLSADPTLVGLRPMIQDIPDTEWMLRERLEPAFESMIDHGLVFDALVKPPHLPALLELAGRYPELSIVLDHGAKPPIAGGDVSAWKRDVAALARDTPMACKLSGLVTEANSADAAVLEECVNHLLECFGPARLLWGSDWPVCELVCSYADWHATTARLLASLGSTERELIYSQTARKTYGI